MNQYETASGAIVEKARSERLFLHYALALAVILVAGGSALVVLGVGDHLDIVVKGRGDLEARFVNATPGVVLWLLGAAVFWASKPRRLRTRASSSKKRDQSTMIPVVGLSIDPQEIEKWQARMGVLRVYGRDPNTGDMIRMMKWTHGPRLFNGTTNVGLPDGTEPEEISTEVALAILAKHSNDLSNPTSQWSRLVKSYGEFGKPPRHLTLRENAAGYYLTDSIVTVSLRSPPPSVVSLGYAQHLVEMRRVELAREAGTLPNYVIRIYGVSEETEMPIVLCRGQLGSYRPYVTDGETFVEVPDNRSTEYITHAVALRMLSEEKARMRSASGQVAPGQGDEADEVTVLYQTVSRPSLTREDVATYDQQNGL